MAQADPRSGFVRRFDRIWLQARRVQFWQAACWALLTALAGVALLAAADYAWELARPWRVVAAAAIAAISLGIAGGLAIRSVRRWRRNATASAIERVFPQLGQRIRTTVQYGELSTNEIQASGVTGVLVAALEDDTVRRAQPLPLDAVVPWKPLAFASLLAACIGLLLAGASAFDWQWRIAVQRALLSEEPYTRLAVSPGSQSVKEGESLPLEITVEGRIGEHVLLATRRLDEEGAAWSEERLPAADGKEAGRLRLAFETSLAKIRHPLEYRVAAGSAQSETYRIEVRYPLKLVSIEAAIKPPEYTRLPETVTDGGDITALVGSQVKLAVELDRIPASAYLEMQDTSSKARREKRPPERIPLAIDGKRLTTEFEVVSDQTFSVIAASADGMELAENKHRLRARQDEPPQVWFESPAEAVEVHSLAEVLMRIRVSDDFGLSRAGVMFEVNNEEEYPLLAEDFAAAAEELQTAGELSPQTRAALEKVLPLEHFELTQQDSVMYYAFAEDIRPASPQRSESDLRFIDIRPFRRQYRLIDPEVSDLAQGPQLKTLEELIARQRYALNRAIRLSRAFEHGGQVDLSAVDSLTKFEGELAQSTRELAEGLEARGIDETELLYQAETSMLAAADSLAAGKYDTATLQMRDALKDLIEGRNRLQILIFKNPDRALLAQLRLFDRLQRQKLRRPKNDAEEAQQVVERLNELADAEDFVYAALADISDPNGAPMNSPGAGEPGAEPPEMPDQPAPDQPAPGQSAGKQPPADSGGPADKQEKSQSGDSEQGSGEGKAGDEKPSAAAESRAAMQELEDRQLDAALEAREVEKALEKLKAATDLSKERMAEAAKAAEAASEALDRGKSDEARAAAGEAKEKFRQLAEQVAALAAKEQADRIAAAQQMAAELARRQEEFKDNLASSEDPGVDGQPRPGEERPQSAAGPGEMAGDSAGDGVAAAARQIAEQAKTLADVLAAAARADSPQDQESAAKVDALMKSLDLKGLAERLGDLPRQVRDEKFVDARAAADDGAERAEAAAEQLGALRRAIVSPRIDELAKLEERLAALDGRLDELNSEAEIGVWHEDADDLLQQLEGAGIEEDLRKEFVDEMQKSGWNLEVARRVWNWRRLGGGFYIAPQAYRQLLSRLAISLRARMQELMLGDLTAEGDEPVPPQYQDLVDRYYQLLAAEKQDAEKRPPAAP